MGRLGKIDKDIRKYKNRNRKARMGRKKKGFDIMRRNKIIGALTALTIGITSVGALAMDGPGILEGGQSDVEQTVKLEETEPSISVDLETGWTETTRRSHTYSSPLRSTSTNKNSQLLPFVSATFFDMQDIAAYYASYGLDDDTSINFYFDIYYTHESGTCGDEDLQGIENTVLEGSDPTSGLCWDDVTVGDYTFNFLDFFEYNGTMTWNNGCAEIAIKLKEGIDDFCEYFELINESDTPEDYAFPLSIDDFYVGDVENGATNSATIWDITVEISGNLDEYTFEASDTDYIQLYYKSSSGGGGGGSSSSTPAPTNIATGECGDSLNWTLDNAGALTIDGTGDMWNYKHRE